MYLSYSSSPLVKNRYQGDFPSIALALNSASSGVVLLVCFFDDDEELAFLFAGFLDGKEGDASLAALFVVVVVSERRVVTMLDTNDVVLQQWALDGRDVDEINSTNRKNFMPIDKLWSYYDCTREL
jgi:hypothetical protein